MEFVETLLTLQIKKSKTRIIRIKSHRTGDSWKGYEYEIHVNYLSIQYVNGCFYRHTYSHYRLPNYPKLTFCKNEEVDYILNQINKIKLGKKYKFKYLKELLMYLGIPNKNVEILGYNEHTTFSETE